MAREIEADWDWEEMDVVGSIEETVDGVIPTYETATCWRSNWGFFGLTARMITSTIAIASSAKKEKRRKRQQQQPLNEADFDDVCKYMCC